MNNAVPILQNNKIGSIWGQILAWINRIKIDPSH